MSSRSISPYESPFLLANGHIDTIIPHLFRRVKSVDYNRERLELPDGDFLDLDWALTTPAADKLVVFSHGLEGSSRAKYIQGMIPHFQEAGFDALAWNCRSCSGEMNRLPVFYHSGASYDLSHVLDHVLKTRSYNSVHLIGFSMGGNISLKYLGERSQNIDARIKNAVVFSVPLDLRSATQKLTGFWGRIYTRKFIRTLNRKLEAKRQALEKLGIRIDGADDIWDFQTWDDRFTAPIHGFKNAEEYYLKCSSRPLLGRIRIPTLIVNALNDPFLGQECFSSNEVEENPYVRFETPAQGGHVGFSRPDLFWSEALALAVIGGKK